MFTRHSASRFVAGLALAAGLAACTAEPNAPEVSQNGVMRSTGDVTAFRGNAQVCKSSTDASKPVTGKFVLEATAGLPTSASFSVMSGDGTSSRCVEVWTGEGMSSEQTAEITVTELVDPGYELVQVIVTRDGQTIFDSNVDGLNNIIKATAISGTGLFFQFKNQPKDEPPPPPPPGGGEGCTPGYWKQPHHFDSWTGYSPNQSFSSAFGGSTAFGSMTLLQVLSQGGGGLKALGRHAVAALLNSASGGVDYAYTTAGVVSAFNDAVAAQNYGPLKDDFEDENERGCPLN